MSDWPACPSELDAAIVARRANLRAMSASHPDRAAALLEFSLTLQSRYHRNGVLADRQRDAAAVFDRVIAEIQAKPGFDGFLKPRSARELARTAVQGSVVVVNVSRFGSHALILREGEALEPVAFPGLTPERVAEQVSAFLALVSQATPADSGSRLAAVLGWLWDAIAEPVLGRLGIAGPPAGTPWPRLWWCVPGPLSFLPLHAAGHHQTRSDAVPLTVIDRAVSSYTPTIRALTYASRPTEGCGAANGRNTPGLLVVSMPRTPGAPDLPSAEAEAGMVLSHSGGRRAMTLIGPEATYASALRALPEASWAHFACHAAVDLAHPSESHLLLDDHDQRPLTVADMARLRLNDAELAFLSACSTASPGARLTDEATHLVPAFQLIGYRHVIGTLWPVSDFHAAQLAAEFYGALAGAETADSAAAALHSVTRRMRDRWFRAPSVWASHIDAGA